MLWENGRRMFVCVGMWWGVEWNGLSFRYLQKRSMDRSHHKTQCTQDQDPSKHKQGSKSWQFLFYISCPNIKGNEGVGQLHKWASAPCHPTAFFSINIQFHVSASTSRKNNRHTLYNKDNQQMETHSNIIPTFIKFYSPVSAFM